MSSVGRQAATFAAKVAGVKAWGGKPGIEQAEDVGEQLGDALVPDPVAVVATVVTGGIGRGALRVAEEAADIGKLGTAARKAAAKKATSKLGQEAAAHIDEAAGRRLVKETEARQAKKIRSLEKRKDEHLQKLDAYKRHPEAFDNLNYLQNAPSAAVREQIISARVRHLEHEIANFDKQIAKARRELK